MAHTYVCLLFHVVFSTKNREPHIDAELKDRLVPYLGGVVRELGGKALKINGTADHLHMHLSLPATLAIADAMRIIKTNSSRWVHEQWASRASFQWQTGYGAFTVSQSMTKAVTKYIVEQEKHHRGLTFQEEFLALLEKHGIEYDDRYIWE
jgi:REP element-mobilizing transposase RayT